MAGPNLETLFNKKQASIEKMSEAKILGMEMANAFNNATEVYTALLAHPDIDPTKAAKDLMDWVKFFLGLKDELRPEEEKKSPSNGTGMTETQAVEETKKVFEGSEVTPPKPNQPSGGKFTIKDPYANASPAQQGKIVAMLLKHGYKETNKQNAVIEMILGLPNTPKGVSIYKQLNKSQASKVIEELINMEAKKYKTDDVPF